ncbi:MAG TPA: hypothetical protein VGH86_17065 [Phenylobacterium sp.]|jgi:hypothetical protein
MSRLALPAVLLGALACSAPALAETPSTPVAKAWEAMTASKPPVALPSTRKALTADEMASISGGAEVSVEVLNRQQLTGTTTGNTITAGSLVSGTVNFSDNALNGFTGIGNFVVNTGANNTLQGAISVSVVTTPP